MNGLDHAGYGGCGFTGLAHDHLIAGDQALNISANVTANQFTVFRFDISVLAEARDDGAQLFWPQ